MQAGCWARLDSSSNTVFDLTDALGSVLASFSNVANSAAIKGNQVFGPYGNFRDHQGTINTTKGFTGQYNDSLTGLDYYGSRYYDQVAGVFLSADVKQGNMQGMDPYSYVGGNPETRSDPTGQCFADMKGDWALGTPSGGMVVSTVGYDGPIVRTYTNADMHSPYYDPLTDSNNSPGAKFGRFTGWTDLTTTLNDPHASWVDKAYAINDFVGTNVNNLLQIGMLFAGGEEEAGAAGADALLKDVADDSTSATNLLRTSDVTSDSDVVTYSRVQGGTPPKASQFRIFVNDDGSISIPNKDDDLYVSVGDEHANYFQGKRGPDSEIVQFDVPKWFDDFVSESKIEQGGYTKNPLNQGGTVPKEVDPTTPGLSYGFPPPWIQWLEEYATNGRVIG